MAKKKEIVKKKKVCLECGGSGLDHRVPAEDKKVCPNCMGTGLPRKVGKKAKKSSKKGK